MTQSPSRPRTARSRAFTLLAALIGSLLLLPFVPAAAAGVRPTSPVAVAGGIAPGTNGQTFSPIFFDEPMINAQDDVAFAACYNNSTAAGIFLRHDRTLRPVVVNGQTTVEGMVNAPCDVSNVAFDGPTLNNAGTVAFVAGLTGGTSSTAVYQKKLNQPLAAVARQGDATPAGGVFVNFDDLHLNNHGDLAFLAAYNDGTQKSGLFLKQGANPLQVIVKTGDALPGTGGATYCGTNSYDLDGPWLNDNGVIAFKADVTCGGTGSPSGSLFLQKPSQPLQLLVLNGALAPASIGGYITDIKIGEPGLTNTQIVLEIGNDATTIEYVLGTHSLNAPAGGFTQCAKDGQNAPAGGGVISMNGNPTIADDGTIGIALSVNSDLTDGIFTCKSGTLKAVALQGDHKPIGTGQVYGTLEEESSGEGHVVFLDEGSSLPGVYESAK